MTTQTTKDERWITVKPNGEGAKGAKVLLNNAGEVVAGMGGKFNGQKLSDLNKSNHPSKMSVAEIESELSSITSRVDAKKLAAVNKAGVNANSVYSGIASGSLSFQTEEETNRIYALKQELAQRGPEIRAAARQRNLERRANRKKPATSDAAAQDEKVAKVMREFEAGTLRSSSGELVTSRKQAMAIALSEERG